MKDATQILFQALQQNFLWYKLAPEQIFLVLKGP